MQIVPFRQEHLAEAGALLAARHRRDRLNQPLLPAPFEEVETAQQSVELLLQTKGARGVAAVKDGALQGFLMARSLTAPIWGRAAQIPYHGHAATRADLYRDLYAALAADLVRDGFLYHQAVVPAGDQSALQAWFSLTFGQEQVHALQPVQTEATAPTLPPGVSIRRAGPTDLEAILEVAHLIAEHQAASPVFGILLPEQPADWREGWAEMLADPNSWIYIAEQEGRILGHQAWEVAAPSLTDLLTPPDAAYLNVAATRPECRGMGLGQALTFYGMREAAERGALVALTDWRATNLLSSRFWPRQGFQPVAYRLTRRIDERIAWAHGGRR